MPRLRRSDPNGPGIARRRAGRGFSYRDATGELVADATRLERIRGLAVPPAWHDVWICPYPDGHLQAVGTDAAGRRQYRYHDEWRRRRDRAKFDRVLRLARRLPRLRTRLRTDLRADGALNRSRVLAAVVRLLDVAAFRVGSEEYAVNNQTYGLTTLQRQHVTQRDGQVWFDYTGKYGQRWVQVVDEPDVRAVVAALRRRRSPADAHLFCWRDGRRWCEVRSDHVNDYLRRAAGLEVTAKDFRTWHGTLLMALLLATDPPVGRGRRARARSVAVAYREVAEYLGNTPAIARSSYVDPRLVDLYHSGVTVADVLRRLPAPEDIGTDDTARRALERGVGALLRDDTATRR